jgi:hypothetical protein
MYVKPFLFYLLMIPAYLLQVYFLQFQSDIKIMFGQLNEWFKANLISLNFDKIYFIQFTNKSICNSDIQIMYDDKHIFTAIETKFLGLVIINNISWKRHIECIKSKLSSACYAMRSVKPYVSINILKMIYYSCFHSLIPYGLLFLGYSMESIKIFRLQKKIIRIMMGCGISDSCRKMLFNLEILPLPSQYILSLLWL